MHLYCYVLERHFSASFKELEIGKKVKIRCGVKVYDAVKSIFLILPQLYPQENIHLSMQESADLFGGIRML